MVVKWTCYGVLYCTSFLCHPLSFRNLFLTNFPYLISSLSRFVWPYLSDNGLFLRSISVTWFLWLATAATITIGLTDKLDCNFEDKSLPVYHCKQLKMIVSLAWFIWFAPFLFSVIFWVLSYDYFRALITVTFVTALVHRLWAAQKARDRAGERVDTGAPEGEWFVSRHVSFKFGLLPLSLSKLLDESWTAIYQHWVILIIYSVKYDFELKG